MRVRVLLSKNNYKNLNNLELIKLIQENDEEAKEYFVIQNQGLVYSCVQKFLYKGNKDDLFQIGCVGLMKAINHFDLSREVQFSTYAVPIILGEIKRSFRDDQSIRVSRSIKENYVKMMRFKDEYVQRNHKDPSYEEIAKGIGCEVEHVYIAFDAHQHLTSIDEDLSENDGKSISLSDQLSKDERDHLLIIALNKEVNALSQKEKLILYLRFSLGYKQSEIAKRLNCTQVQVSRIEKQILSKLKDKMI